MLGLGSMEMALAFILCIAASLLCIIYGIINWNKTGLSSEELREQVEWAKHDRDLKKTLP